MKTRGKVLVIDDETQLRKVLSRIIELEGYEVLQAEDATVGLKLITEHKDLLTVVCDVRLPDYSGMQLLERIKKKGFLCEIIMLTAYGTISEGVFAMKQGAFDYLTKGDGDEQIIVVVEKACEKARLGLQIQDLEKRLGTRYSFDRIIGKSAAIKDAISLAVKVSATDSTVLLEGETGTGKELFAQSIHTASSRSKKPFIAVNCSALPHDLLESEIFGHVKGSFTGAISDKKGLFEEADEGTLFLDEIGEMHPDLQVKLLRVLEEKTITRIGSSKAISVDVRIIAATNRDLYQESIANRFRSDLYYRLSVFRILIPSLRERKEDIPLLADYFLKRYSVETNKSVETIPTPVMENLVSYSWPGNTRELRNVIERAVILTDSKELTEDLVPCGSVSNEEGKEKFIGATLEDVEKEYIIRTLNSLGGNKTKTAKYLGISVPTLYRKIYRYKI